MATDSQKPGEERTGPERRAAQRRTVKRGGRRAADRVITPKKRDPWGRAK